MPHTPAHKHSCRSAGLLRRIRLERADIQTEQEWRENIAVALPPTYEGDENVTFNDVLADKVPHARLKLHGKVTSKAKIAAMLADSDGEVAEHRKVIRECTRKLNALGVKA